MRVAEPFLITVLALAAGVFGFGADPSGAAYSDEQARLGQAVYEAKCQSCHGLNQEGGDEAPPLKGKGFWSEWEHGTARAVYSRIISTMPPDNAGSLAPADVINLVECLMKANELPSGGKAVNSPDELNLIELRKPNS